jgi:hypothetical protein
MGESKRRKQLGNYGQPTAYSEFEQMERRGIAILCFEWIIEEEERASGLPASIDQERVNSTISTFTIGDRHNTPDQKVFDIMERTYKDLKKNKNKESTAAAVAKASAQSTVFNGTRKTY